MDFPTFGEIQDLHDRAQSSRPHENAPKNLVPCYRDLLVDLETPVSAYCKIAQHPFSFLLESVAGGEHIARYSFIGVDPYLVLTHTGETATLRRMSKQGTPDGQAWTTEEIACHDPLTLVQAELEQYHLVTSSNHLGDELPRFHGGAVGYLAYEVVSHFEHLPVPEKDELGLPLAVFCFTETVLVFDHLKRHAKIVTHLHLDEPKIEMEYQRVQAIIEDIHQRLRQPVSLPHEPEPSQDAASLQVVANQTQNEFEAKVQRAKEYIRAGDIFQVVPSQRLSRHVNASPFTVYRALRAINPSPYMFFLDLQDFQIIGASPESLVQVEDGQVTIRPIAGTRRRGKDKSSDLQLEHELRNDPKERAEHIMLVDLGRNDVGKVSIPGSVHMSEFMEIERYSHVMHLVSRVTGRLRDEVSSYDALRAGFPAGTVSGAPKIRAMEIISELEGEQRGIYAGAVGYFSYAGNLDTAIAIRTMVMRNGRAYIQAGGGVVADSDPSEEYHESLNKARALLRALDEAEAIAHER